MTVPTFSQIERHIRAAWSGNPGATLGPDPIPDEIQQQIELLAAAPFDHKPAAAAAVRAAWVRAGGVTPLVPTPGISNPLSAPARFPY